MSTETPTQTTTQLQQLTAFLLTSLSPIVKSNDLDAWQENGTLILNGEDKGSDGYQVAKWKHNAVIALERFPHRRINPYNLLAMVAAFLIDSDWQRDEYGLDDPQLDIDVVSKDHATVLIEVQLIDNIELLPDPNGPVLFNGENYRVSLVPLNIAETVDVQQKGADV
tara:strand:+ start:694 stop:1194 length:501 start_codon:yes stop_codon:yes gene_type:complete